MYVKNGFIHNDGEHPNSTRIFQEKKTFVAHIISLIFYTCYIEIRIECSVTRRNVPP